MQEQKLHYLQTKWTYWFDNGKSTEKSNSNEIKAKQVYTFGTAEEFWGLYEGLGKITNSIKGSDSFVFRENYLPKTYENGGRLTFTIPIGSTEEQSDFVEDVWLKLMLFCIGETIIHRENIFGISFSLRSTARLYIYLNSLDETIINEISSFIKDYFKIKDNIKFFPHKN